MQIAYARSIRRIDNKLFTLIVLVVLVVFSATGGLNYLVNRFAMAHVKTESVAYLDSAAGRASKGFIVLSGIKAFLSVLEGSTVGVGFGLQVGDLVQATVDHVDFAWKTVLAATVVLWAMRFSITVTEAVGSGALTVAFLVLAATYAVRIWIPRAIRFRSLLSTVTAYVMTAAITLYLVVPLTVFGASRLSQKFTAEEQEKSMARMETFRDELDPPVAPEDNKTMSMIEKARMLKDRFETLVDRCRPASVIETVANMVGTYVFDCLVFPLAVFVLLFSGLRVCMRWTTGEDKRLTDVMTRYYKDWRPLRQNAETDVSD